MHDVVVLHSCELNRPTDQQTDIRGHKEATLPISLCEAQHPFCLQEMEIYKLKTKKERKHAFDLEIRKHDLDQEKRKEAQARPRKQEGKHDLDQENAQEYIILTKKKKEKISIKKWAELHFSFTGA